MIDFTKASDTVDHVILLHELSQLSLTGFVINCIYLVHFCPVDVNNGLLSGVIDIGFNM